jgi:hypothetical protein
MGGTLYLVDRESYSNMLNWQQTMFENVKQGAFEDDYKLQGNNTLFLYPPTISIFPDLSVRCNCTMGFSICIQYVLEYETRIFY